MKKTILLILLLTGVFCSCDNGTKREPLTERGMQICHTWENVTNSIIQDVASRIFYLNDWILAPDSIRPILESQYFFDGHVLDKGEGIYEIYSKYGTLFLWVDTHNDDLSQSGTIWEIHKLPAYSMQAYSYSCPAFVKETENVFNLTALGGNSWEIVMDSATCAGSSLDLTIHVPGISTPVELFSHHFTVEGHGLYHYSETDDNSMQQIVELTFNIQEELVNGTGQIDQLAPTHYWDAGKVALAATKKGRDEIDVTVEFIGGGTKNISYRGITEQW
ncbi:MAG: hypothetical protein MJZ70_04875 [Bacteroidales bacterium]|nr:hypothetical protein [Bacteroidales bacterium]